MDVLGNPAPGSVQAAAILTGRHGMDGGQRGQQSLGTVVSAGLPQPRRPV